MQALPADGVPNMRNLTEPAWIKAKGFLRLGLLATALVLVQRPSLQVAALLIIAIWGFCRFYYFAFYVIEHYVDRTYRFTGLLSFRALFDREDVTRRKLHET